MQLSIASRRRCLCMGALVCALAGARASAQESQRIDIHGFYYKETSTRVLQPRVELTAEIPQSHGTTVRAFYLLDAITSASIAAGAARDNTLTEFRNEVGLAVTQPVGPVALSGYYLRSRESDYDSDTVGGSLAFDLFEKNTTWTLGYAHTFDTVLNRVRRVAE